MEEDTALEMEATYFPKTMVTVYKKTAPFFAVTGLRISQREFISCVLKFFCHST
jgi:hypothetical protein